jgi:type II secretory pathway pseudopilin PulG
MDGIVGRVMQIAVGLILLVGVVVGGQKMFASSKASNAVSDMMTLEQNIQSAYSAQPNFTTLTNTASNAGGWTPSDMVNGTSGITNQWGGTVTVAVDATSTQFDLTETNVPPVACTTMANGAQGAMSVTVNGSALAGTAPFDPATVATACSTGQNTLKFVFGH